MSNNLKLGNVTIPVTQYASQGNAILGIRDSGKTYTATYIAEQLYAAGIPFVAFDPSGTWKFLRVPGEGKGLPVVVAGGKAPDLPLTPHSAPEIVRAAMKANVSLVIDLYDIHLSKADWSRIVEACIRVLLYENGDHGLRHIFIEEAAEFVPQQIQSDKAKVYAEVEKLARIGGNALLGYTLVNQRAEQVNKAVLELCDCLLLHRQKGKNSLNSLSKWLEYSQGGDVKTIIKGLPTLPSGQCWIWPANAENATLVKMPQKNSFHPDRRALIANPAAANFKRVDATKFVSELKSSLEVVLQDAEANDPKKLKARIVELERALNKAPEYVVDKLQLAQEYKRGFDEAKLSANDEAMKTGFKIGALRVCTELETVIAEEMKKLIAKIATNLVPPDPIKAPTPVKYTVHPLDILRSPQAAEALKALDSMAAHAVNVIKGDSTPPSVRKILDVIHNSYPVSLSFEAAARRAGISNRSSAYRKYRALVTNSNEVEQGRSNRLTSLPQYAKQGAMTAKAGIEQWIAKLPPSYGKMLAVIAENPFMDKAGVAKEAGVSTTSSGLNSGLRELMDLELVNCEDGLYTVADGL